MVDLADIFMFISLTSNFGVNYKCKGLYFSFYKSVHNGKHADWLFKCRLGIIETG